MIATLVDLIFGSTTKKVIIIGLAAVSIIGFFQVKSCQHKNELIRQLKADIKILEQDRKIDRQTEDRKNDVENYQTQEDFRRGFDNLRGYGR